MGSSRAKETITHDSLTTVRAEYAFVQGAWKQQPDDLTGIPIAWLTGDLRGHLVARFPTRQEQLSRLGFDLVEGFVLTSLLNGLSMTDAGAQVPVRLRDTPLNKSTVSKWVETKFASHVAVWIENWKPDPRSGPGDSGLPGGDAPFLPLGHPGVTRERFGMKAALLSRLASSGTVAVPEGWCVELQPETHTSVQLRSTLEAIWSEVMRLDTEVIVRSSASVEDQPNALFAGRFKSIPGICSRPGLHVAAAEVLRSVDDLSVRDYLDAHGLDRNAVRMAFLVQRQVESEFAGITFVRRPQLEGTYQVTVEFIDGSNGPLLEGTALGARYELAATEGEGVEYRHESGPDYDARKIVRFLPRVFESCKLVADFFGTDQDIEWVWDGEVLWIVQARELAGGVTGNPQQAQAPSPSTGYSMAGKGSGAVPELKSLPESREWGLKGAAEEYFQRRLGRGAPRSLLIFPGEDRDRVVQELSRREEAANGTVLRFSYRAQVGLPRRFVPHGEDVVGKFMAIWGDHPDWMGILSDYLFINSSFEAYVSATSLLVEHVPGNWETGNRLPPDLFLITRERGEFWGYNDYRLASLEIPGKGAEAHTQRVPPLRLPRAAEWAPRFVADFRKIRDDFVQDLPVNVHFVSDPDDDFHFLNIRPTRRLDLEAYNESSLEFKANRMFRVENPKDVAAWDGVSKILVDAVADRGNESRIAGVAVALREAGVRTVYCTFGLLSHPAIVLREFDLRVEPLYVAHDIHQLDMRW